MSDTTSEASSAECRAEFEAWAKSHDLAYKSSDPAAMWTWAAWQAAWNRRAQPVAHKERAMTDTTSAAPSDAEIDAQWRESVAKHETTAAFVRAFARAVLAKWGAPQPVARKPMEADVSAVNGINARIHFRRGWRAAEVAHGIGTEKGDSHA